MADEILRHMLLGFIRLHVLYHAAKEPICGVELMVELREHGYHVGPGTLYPLLHQLEADGHLRSREQVVGGRRRKNIRATAKGKRLLAKARGKLRKLAGELIDDVDGRSRRKNRT